MEDEPGLKEALRQGISYLESVLNARVAIWGQTIFKKEAVYAGTGSCTRCAVDAQRNYKDAKQQRTMGSH
jgi:hypothetical protein